MASRTIPRSKFVHAFSQLYYLFPSETDDLNMVQVAILRALKASPSDFSAMRTQEIGGRLPCVKRMRLLREIGRLDDQGYVNVEPYAADKKQNVVSITRAGVKAFEEIELLWQRVTQAWLSSLDDGQEQKILTELLTNVAQVALPQQEM